MSRDDPQWTYLSSAFQSASAETGLVKVLGEAEVPVKTVFCCECGEKLQGKAYEVPSAKGQYLCQAHYEKYASKCEGCNQAIFGQFVKHGGKKFHAQCYNVDVQCARCHRPIFGEALSAIDRHWHPQCFTCAKCNDKLPGEFQAIHGEPYCIPCATTPTLIRTGAVPKSTKTPADIERERQRLAAESDAIYGRIQEGKEKCAGCFQVLNLEGISYQGYWWHPTCLPCAGCGQTVDVIDKGFSEQKGDPYCSACSRRMAGSGSGSRSAGPSCPGCGQGLTGTCVSFKGQGYHQQCFRCTSCKRGLSEGYTEKGGQPYCTGCAGAATVVTGPYAKGFVVDPITGKKKFGSAPHRP